MFGYSERERGGRGEVRGRKGDGGEEKGEVVGEGEWRKRVNKNKAQGKYTIPG